VAVGDCRVSGTVGQAVLSLGVGGDGVAEFLVADVVGQHVPDRGDDRVFDGDQCPERAAALGLATAESLMPVSSRSLSSRVVVRARLRTAERLLNRDLLTPGPGTHDLVLALRISDRAQ